jgi:ribosomal protein S4E
MTVDSLSKLSVRDGAPCKVIGGTHAGKTGTVRDIKTGKSGHVSITVVQTNGERFKTLAKNVAIQAKLD